jgi:16S rRNA (uracil1498-N3)-methyltransferase
VVPSAPVPGDSRNPASDRAATQVFVSDLEAVTISGEDAHHLATVLRLKRGETVIASDGRGSWRSCIFIGSQPWIEPITESRFLPQSTDRVTVGFVPVKGDRPEWVVQKLTEVGVDRIVVLRSERSVVRWEGPRAGGVLERLGKVATSAAAQSRRPWIPEVAGVFRLAEFAQVGPIILAEHGGQRLHGGAPICVGPEGGWTDAELELASETVGLGAGVLRSETAAVVAGVLACAERDRLLPESGK